ncbi:Helix-turn-helix domain-containing protein [Paenibacillus sp. UNCCL117]|uniref:helix-turn-helix domain-containing protein n=1 Tax=unclassified Paenibacillus TaxID=185978 RepID=UPI00088E4452|nr:MULTISPECIES: helix-turn-helix domain-containing protein [unclassified Paenibacillus]SDE11900.1 Helix-turn-helix domain-containing protein [Paenibacillus sp. cl123]SFW60075.1 Helix-turn-helix domain-containing protein [Paenibacillus sp. UNCCL117]
MFTIKHWTLKQQLLLFSLVLSLVPLLILGFVSSLLSTRSLQDEVDRNYQIILKQIQAQVDNYVSRMDQISLTLASNDSLIKIVNSGISMDQFNDWSQATNVIQQVIVNSDIPFDVSLILTNFNTTYSHKMGIIREINFPHNELVKLMQLPNNAYFVVPPHTYTNQNELLIVRSVPLNTVSPKGVLVLQLDTNRLQGLFEQFTLSGNRTIFLFDEQGKMITTGNSDVYGIPLSVATSALLPYMTGSQLIPEQMKILDTQFALSSVKSNVNGWTYLAISPMKEITQKTDQIQHVSFLIIALTALFWALVAMMGTSRLLLPLQELFYKFSTKENQDKSSKLDIVKALDRHMEDLQFANTSLLRRLDEQMPLMRESYLLRLIRGEITHSLGDEGTRAYLEPLRGDWFYVGVVEIDQLIGFKRMYKDQDRSTIMYVLRNLVTETLEAHFTHLTFSPQLGRVVFIIGFEEITGETESIVRKVGSEIQANMGEHIPFTMSVLIGEACKGYENIHHGYEEALSFIVYRWTLGTNVVITPKEIQPVLSKASRHVVKAERAVLLSLERGEFEKAAVHVSELIREAMKTLRHSDIILGLIAHLIAEIDQLLQESGSELYDVLQEDVQARLFETTSLEELHTWLIQTLLPCVQISLETQQIPRRKKAIEQVIAIIHNNFDSDLSLQQLAEYVQTSPPNLSKWFKMELGENFGEYLIRYRMDKAKEWLLSSDITIKEVADRLRYTSVQNFTRSFKQITGLPPGHFRNRYKEQG